jgi:hypothetical protein
MRSYLLGWSALALVSLQAGVSFGYQTPLPPSPESIVRSDQHTIDATINSRRKALQTAFTAIASTAVLPFPALADVNVKVTNVAHTFVTEKSVKPIRENDATRIFTNARVAFLFTGPSSAAASQQDLLNLTVQRKAGKGAGVTPGNVEVMSSSPSFLDYSKKTLGLSTVQVSSFSVDKIQDVVKSMPDGDVLFVGPIPSKGNVADDAKLVSDLAASMNLKANSEVVSILLDGPTSFGSTDGLSTVLWYSIS